ncbi:endonuclease/exonuclease/phosphatase family protein [Macrococcus carouselicus]|uniref:Endonuclease/exonuclease/phosphatase family protein n=1 Tax=Macrococcus carouselicus TaxID=69969 RepID=A0A9Q8FPU8_9STAP|nr:endonuclease/exonuclease/phosphatase family protein [Macrococcus carouselicus]TDM02388.1 endonuclease/exonuclease/phosphatase family protein [Macrococcus carouselicus]
MKNNNLNILGWNINQRCGKSKNHELPKLISEEILSRNVDIFILTEFYLVKNYQSFIDEMEKNNYLIKYSDHKGISNEVLIGVKKHLINDEFSFKDFSKFQCNLLPDFIHVTLGDLNIIGARIKIGSNLKTQESMDKDFLERENQLKTIVNYTSKLDGRILGLGDFNNGRYKDGDSINSYPGVARQYYSYPLILKYFNDYGIEVHTPKELCSWKDQWNNHYKLDHIFAKDIIISDIKYDWDFTKRDDYKKTVGYPDHAILIAEIAF